MADRCELPEKWRNWPWHWIESEEGEIRPTNNIDDAYCEGWRYLGPALPPAELMRRLREGSAVERLALDMGEVPDWTLSEYKEVVRSVLDAIERELGA